MKKSDNIEDVYTLSPLQEGILFHSIYQKESSAYFVQMVYRLSGDLNIDMVQYSMQELVKRHDILRTSFVYEEMEKPLQIVLKRRELPFHQEDIRHLGSREAQEQFLKTYKDADKSRYFDLTYDCLMRAAIFRLSDTEYEFIWSCHHIIIDGWCLKTLEYEFFALYENARANKAVQFPPAPQYKKYIQWLSERSNEESTRYWEAYLQDYDAPVVIPRLLPTLGPVSAFNNNKHHFEVPDLLHERLLQLAKRHKTTLNNIIRVLWGILIAKYNDQKDAVFGAVVSGRPPQLPESEDIVGLFINTVPVRITFDADTRFRDLLQKTAYDAIASEAFHHSPLADIQNLSALKQSLFDHIIVFENYPTNPELQGLSFEKEVKEEEDLLKLVNEDVYSQNHYPFYIIIAIKPKLEFNFYYNKDLFETRQVLEFCDQLSFLMQQCIENDEICIGELLLVEPGTETYQQLVYGFNQTQRPYLLDTSVKAVFEQVVADYPDRPAIHSREIRYNYRQLNQTANALAGYILERMPFSANTRFVAILTQRADFAVIAMLASVKAGAVFVPIHPDLPAGHIQSILEETGAGMLFLESSMLDVAMSYSGELFALDIQLEMLEAVDQNPDLTIPSEYPLYTIYSSGTTGNPKGVVISNRSLVNYTSWFKDQFDFSPENRAALLSSHAFDLGYTSIWGALLSGAALFLPARDLAREPDALLAYLLDHNITFLKLTPSNLKILLAATGKEALKDSALKLILCGGEKINADNIADFLSINPKTQFVNHYGPTEATIGAIFHAIAPGKLDAYRQFPVIGRPVANDKAYILDEGGRVLPVGAKGDLYLAGEGLAIEYLAKPELSNQKFTQSAWGERLYKTGDKARRFPDGNIAFLGRADHEVKIRGYRVNVEDIERVLAAHSSIEFATVQPQESPDGDLSLAAFVKLRKETPVQELAAFMKAKLPEYMLPGQIIVIDMVPVTANGKLDLKRLKKMTASGKRKEIIPPANETEHKLLAIWEEVLGKEHLSTDDDFFDLGGHSLKAVQIISRIIVDFQITLAVKDIFDHTTIQALALELEKQVASEQYGLPYDEVMI